MNKNSNLLKTSNAIHTSPVETRTSKRQLELIRLAERGFALHQQVVSLTEELKQIKDRLKAEAEARPAELIALSNKESEGSQWVLMGKGCECHIIFPDARVNSEFDPATPEFEMLRYVAGDHFNSLFKKVILYRVSDKGAFREQVHQLLDSKTAVQLLDLSTSPSEPKTLWKARPTSSVN